MIASLISGNNLPKIDVSNVDKIGHLVCYALLGFLLLGTLSSTQHSFFKDKSHKSRFKYTLLMAISYGIVIEILQGTLFVHRSFEIPDIIANIIGALIGTISYTIIFKFLNDTV